MPNIIEEIVNTKRKELEAAKTKIPLRELEAKLKDAPPTLDFLGALSASNEIELIAEVKKASPSKGLIRKDFQPVEIAKSYAENGAACISVLTDEPYFQGKLEYLEQIRNEVSIPLLRKDFILDPYQVMEARCAGADAILLIAECLDRQMLKQLVSLAVELKMTTLVELYDEQNLPSVLDSQTKLIGVNNRDLKTFEVDLQHTVRIREQIPDTIPVVGESGIYTRADALMLQQNNVNAMLVGESLMRQTDVAKAVRILLGKDE